MLAGPTDTFAKLIALMPKFTGGLSMICSALMINHIVRTPGQLSKITNRLLMGVAVSDTLYTFNMPFLSSWMVPRQVFDAFGNEINIFGNVGNDQTCTMQGTVDQFASKCSWTYNAELAFAYFVAVKFRRGDHHLRRFEPLLHFTPLAVGLAAAIAPLPYRAYNFAGGAFCWIADSPLRCGHPGAQEMGAAPCERGANYAALRLWTSNIPCFATQFVVLASMFGLVCSVLVVERRSVRYRRSARGVRANLARTLRRSKKVALKCMLYVLAFEITWFFNLWGVVNGYLGRGDHEVEGPSNIGVIYFLNLLLLPTYGIWGSLAYYLLPFLKVRENHPEWGLGRKLRVTVFPPRVEGDSRWKAWMRAFGHRGHATEMPSAATAPEEAAGREAAGLAPEAAGEEEEVDEAVLEASRSAKASMAAFEFEDLFDEDPFDKDPFDEDQEGEERDFVGEKMEPGSEEGQTMIGAGMEVGDSRRRQD